MERCVSCRYVAGWPVHLRLSINVPRNGLFVAIPDHQEFGEVPLDIGFTQACEGARREE